MSSTFKVTILGSGTSTGVPVIGCACKVCKSGESRNQRYRASILITNSQGRHLVVDTGPEFRLQVLRADVRHLDAVFYTHLHADHCHGFDDLRAFVFHTNKPLKCFLTCEQIDEIKKRFSYAFEVTGYQGAKPQVELVEIKDQVPFEMNGLTLEPALLDHGNLKTSAFRVGKFAYATDFKFFTEKQIQAWKGKIDVMIASGIHFGTHKTHSVIPETIRLFNQLGVKRGILTHLSHDVDYLAPAEPLPSHVELAFDGMAIDVN